VHRGEPETAGAVGWLDCLCDATVGALPVSGAAVSLMSVDGLLGVAAASDLVARALAQLQFTLGEGPCMDAFGARRPVLEPDLLAAAGRWPGYAPAAVARGARAVFSFPLQVGAAQLGVLDLYRSTPGPLSGEALAMALTFAEAAVETLLDAQNTAPAGRAAAGLDQVLDSQYTVYQAQGMTMVDLGVSLADALARLRAHAYAQDRPLGEIARDVVAGRLRLDLDPSPA
jgi:hypothetical protein